MSRFTDTLNAQVGNEFGASQQYVAIAVWYDAETLPQLATFFYRQAVEERNHAMMLVQYLLDAGEDVVIPGIAAPQTTFGTPSSQSPWRWPRSAGSRSRSRPSRRSPRKRATESASSTCSWFLKEQLEEMSSMSALLKTVERAAAVNILLAEDYLARTTGGGAGVEADAPRAAGGAL